MMDDIDNLVTVVEERMRKAIDRCRDRMEGGLEQKEYMLAVGRIHGLKDAIDVIRGVAEDIRLDEEKDDD